MPGPLRADTWHRGRNVANTTTEFSFVNKFLVFELRRLAASSDGARTFESERDALAQTLGMPVDELDAQFKQFQRVAEAELRAWFLRSWFRAYAARSQTGATHRPTFA
jgi:hypothetical protein